MENKIDFDTIKLTIPCFDDLQDGCSISVEIKEDNLICLNIENKNYHISRDNLIRLGKLCKPLRYKDVENGQYKITEKYYE